ncbi:MAG: DUF2231 domain-containing protein [Candidatus Marinimicrobia bacterium]|nr:DUF2231 domain-containing protein [Candidatus Neomarinimicrobiota bacterium]
MIDNLHPVFVHFPIACITVAFFFQLFQVIVPKNKSRNASLWLMGIAAVFALISSQTGELAFSSHSSLNAFQIEEVNTHELFANITTWGTILIFVGWVFAYLQGVQNRKVDILIFAFLSLLTMAVLVTGYLGGKLVHLYHIH